MWRVAMATMPGEGYSYSHKLHSHNLQMHKRHTGSGDYKPQDTSIVLFSLRTLRTDNRVL